MLKKRNDNAILKTAKFWMVLRYKICELLMHFGEREEGREETFVS